MYNIIVYDFKVNRIDGILPGNPFNIVASWVVSKDCGNLWTGASLLSLNFCPGLSSWSFLSFFAFYCLGEIVFGGSEHLGRLWESSGFDGDGFGSLLVEGTGRMASMDFVANFFIIWDRTRVRATQLSAAEATKFGLATVVGVITVLVTPVCAVWWKRFLQLLLCHLCNYTSYFSSWLEESLNIWCSGEAHSGVGYRSAIGVCESNIYRRASWSSYSSYTSVSDVWIDHGCSYAWCPKWIYQFFNLFNLFFFILLAGLGGS